jgi:hypothetical protein
MSKSLASETLPVKTKNGWKISIAWILFTSAVHAWDTFTKVHPWTHALLLWYSVPWTGLIAYWLGRSDQKRSQQKEENQPWLYEDLRKWLNGRREYELFRSRARLNFNFKEKE